MNLYCFYLLMWFQITGDRQVDMSHVRPGEPHLQSSPQVRRQSPDSVGGQQQRRQLPESGAPPQLSWHLLIGRLHAERHQLDQSGEVKGRCQGHM